MYDKCINLFYADQNIERQALRNMIAEELLVSAEVVRSQAKTAKDMEVYSSMVERAYRMKGLDKPDVPKLPESAFAKPIKIYIMDSRQVNLEPVDRKALATRIDAMDIPENEKTRVKREAMAVEIDFIESWMSKKKKLSSNRDDIEILYANWLSQICAIMMPTNFYGLMGRASSKTTSFTVERLQEAVYDCPGAPFAWASDTYSKLHKNVIPSHQEGLRMNGWEEGIHYEINKEPPGDWKGNMYNILSSWQNTMVFFNGFNVTFISLDRPSIGAGRSFVGIFGDEVKYFSEVRIANLIKAVRGYRVKYGNSVFYCSQTFTSDMPDPNRIGEYDWMLKYAAKNDKKKILNMLQVGFVYNETKIEYAAASESKNAHKILLAEKNMKRWYERWVKVRKGSSFFIIASSFINVDILSLDWFDDEFSVGLEGVLTNILSIIPKLAVGDRFYVNLSERHFYADGNNNEYLDTLPFGAEPDCSLLRYL